MSARKTIKMQVWHCGYTCSLSVNMAIGDLRNTQTFRARLCTALFDHGLDTANINRLRDDEMFYVLGSRNVKILNPNEIPTGAMVCFNNVITDTDPPVYRIAASPNLILPVEPPNYPLRSVVDIEQHVRRRLVQYGACMSSDTKAIVCHGKWTICTPSRRNYKRDVVQLTPLELDESEIMTAVVQIQTWYRNLQRNRKANIIKHAILRYLKHKVAEDWVNIE